MRSRLLLRCLAVAGVLAGGVTLLLLLPARASGSGATDRVSMDSPGAQGNGQGYLSSASTGTPEIGASYVSSIGAASRSVSSDPLERSLVWPTPSYTPTPIVPWPTPAPAGATQRVSVRSTGAQGNDASSSPSFSAGGRYVAFHSYATNLVPGDTNGVADIFVHDRSNGVTERVSVDSTSAQGNGNSGSASISADGRYVAFGSSATNLVANDTNLKSDVFVHDRVEGTTELVSVDSTGAQANGGSSSRSISADGRFVAFESSASNLVPDDTNTCGYPPMTWNCADIFVRDRVAGTTERVSVDSAGVQGNNESIYPWISISADGRFVAFLSQASNLVPGDSNSSQDVFLRDRESGTTERVSVDSAGAQVWGRSDRPSISADGRYVAFTSSASTLVAGDSNGDDDVFVRDRLIGTTERASLDSAGAEGNNWSDQPSISADGRYVAFTSDATNLVAGDTNSFFDVFVRDRVAGATERVSVDSAGVQGQDHSSSPSISGDGRYVAFSAWAGNLVPGDTYMCSVPPYGAQHSCDDVFVRDRVAWVAVGGVAEPPDVAALPSAAEPAGSSYAVYIIGAAAALVVALGAAGWRKRRA